MSDQSIASIARALASELMLDPENRANARRRKSEARKRRARPDRVAALERELCTEYRDEVIEAIKV